MEWSLAVNTMLREEITKIGPNLVPENFHSGVTKVRTMQECLGRLIDQLGEQSAAAQGLKQAITTADKLRNSPSHVLYLLKEESGNGGKGDVIGLLKIGRKRLYLVDEENVTRECEPVCVLDFYIRTNRQRLGLGKKIFDRMLEDEGLEAYQLPIDGPSPKMEQFLAKNFGIDRLLKQANNYAVSPLFFGTDEDSGQSGRLTPVPPPVGRFAAPKTSSTIATVIHRGGPSPTPHPTEVKTDFEKSPTFKRLNLEPDDNSKDSDEDFY